MISNYDILVLLEPSILWSLFASFKTLFLSLSYAPWQLIWLGWRKIWKWTTAIKCVRPCRGPFQSITSNFLRILAKYCILIALEFLTFSMFVEDCSSCIWCWGGYVNCIWYHYKPQGNLFFLTNTHSAALLFQHLLYSALIFYRWSNQILVLHWLDSFNF